MAVSINKNWLLLAAAIALGGGAFYLSNHAIHSRILEIEEEATRGKTLVPVVVASQPLSAGDLIGTGSVSVRQIPSEFVSRNMVTPDAYDSVDGQALLVDMDRGEPLQVSYTASRGGELFAATLKSGRRALTIDVDEISSISGMLRPGDRIDLMLTARAGDGGDGEDREMTFPMLSNIEVLATGRTRKGAAGGEASARGYAHVTLDVEPEDATRIIAAKAGGSLTAVLRAPGDHLRNPSEALSLADVVAGKASSRSRIGSGSGSGSGGGSVRTVEFLIGGSGSGGGVSHSPVLDSLMKDPLQRAQAESVARQMLAQGLGAGADAAAVRQAPRADPAAGIPAAGIPAAGVPATGLPSTPSTPSTPSASVQ